MPRLLFIFCITALSLPGYAQDPTLPSASPEIAATTAMPRSNEEKNVLAVQAQKLKSEAISIKAEATRQHELSKIECWNKFLVSLCLDGARQVFRQEESRARQREREAKLIERNIRLYDAAEDTAKRDADNARRDAPSSAKGKTTAAVEVSP